MMGFEAAMATTDAPLPANSRDFGKKKRANRSAKLKQCKLDARREQWLSQGIGGMNLVSAVDQPSSAKGKGSKVAPSPTSPPSSLPLSISLPREGHDDAKRETDMPNPHDGNSESDFWSSDWNSSGKSSRKECPSNSSCRGSSTRSCSRSNSDADGENGRGEENGTTLDDWEAVADALSADNDDAAASVHSVPPSGVAFAGVPVATPAVTPIARTTQFGIKSRGTPAISRAWRPDDVFRPQSLPNLSKQRSLQENMERRCDVGGWPRNPIAAVPGTCPICCEDLDPTDSSFLPCLCGFRLCLFCHKRILEADGRCPGCRKQYNHAEGGGQMGASGKGVFSIPLRLPRSFSMNSRA